MDTAFRFKNTSDFPALECRLYFNLTRSSVTGVKFKGYTFRNEPILRPLYIEVELTDFIPPGKEVEVSVTYQGEHPDLREISWPQPIPGGHGTSLPGLQVPTDANAQILVFERRQADAIHAQHDKAILPGDSDIGAENREALFDPGARRDKGGQ